jgi:Mor family transcriptional regulator
VNESIATPIAEAVLDALRDEFAGRALYIPARSKAARNAAVLAEFNGRNHAEVCKKHDISRRTLYELIGRRRAGG